MTDLLTRPTGGGHLIPAPQDTLAPTSNPSESGGQSSLAPHMRFAPALDIPPLDDQIAPAHHVGAVVQGLPSQGGGSTPSAVTTVPPTPLPDENDWLRLRIWAEMFDDAQKSRIAMENRALRGGVDPSVFRLFLDQMESAEASAKKGLRTTYREVVPVELREYQANTRGIGEHLFARFLGHLGHPIHTTPKWWENKVLVSGDPIERTLAQLRQYCGHGAPSVRRKGMSQEEAMWNGNPTIKMILHLLAESVVKSGGSHLREVYDKSREVEHVHTVECVRCGPSGKPAQPDSPWSKGHSHAHGMRLIGKQILKDIHEICS